MTDWYNPFGYWVSPEGEITPIDGTMGHEDKAREIREEVGLGNCDDPQYELMKAGWVHVVVSTWASELGVSLREFKSRRQRDSTVRIVREHARDGSESFVLDGRPSGIFTRSADMTRALMAVEVEA